MYLLSLKSLTHTITTPSEGTGKLFSKVRAWNILGGVSFRSSSLTIEFGALDRQSGTVGWTLCLFLLPRRHIWLLSVLESVPSFAAMNYVILGRAGL